MRSRNMCPKCSCEELYVIDPWQTPDHDSSNRVEPVAVAFPLSAIQRYVALEFELWVCARCAYSEMYAKGVQNLASAVEHGVEGIRRVVKPRQGYR